MIPRSKFHRLWPPVLLLFQLFGYVTYTREAPTLAQKIVRSSIALVVIVAIGSQNAYALFTKVSIHEKAQINIMSDQSVYLSILPTQLVTLVEALLKQANFGQLFEQMYDIARQLNETTHDNNDSRNCRPTIVNFVHFRRNQLWRNWLQVVGTIAGLAIGIALTGVQSWMYFRWIVLAELFVSVRLMEVSMQVEIMAMLLNALNGYLSRMNKLKVDDDERNASESLPSVEERLARLQSAIGIYGSIHLFADAISVTYGWSMFAISLYSLNGMINTSFWFVYATYSGAVQIHDQISMILYYVVIMTRLYDACENCARMRTRIAVTLFAIPNPERCSVHSQMVREFGRQIMHEPIRITVLGGVLVLNYKLFGSMLSIVVTYTIILMQFQQDEGKFNVIDDLY